jgi:glycosyltransferase involved in cell wall biosynthesis
MSEDRLFVAVNLTWLAPGRVGGSEQYLTRQLAGLPDDSGTDVRLFAASTLADAHPELARRYPIETMPLRGDVRGGRLVAEHTWLAVRTRRADVVHHGGGTAPLIGRRPIVLTVHDLQYLEFPHYFSRARRAYLRAMMPQSVRRAAVVTTPSAFVKGTVVDAFGVDPERVHVVPHGLPAAAQVTPEAIVAVRAEFGLGDRPYLVYPAITHPHKGHSVVIDMLAHGADLDPSLLLVLVGGEGSAESSLRAQIERSGVGDRVVRPGRVSDHTRDVLIAGASALVFPTEYEGFGAPLIEAMLLGTPVVCSARAAVPEVAGDAAIVVVDADPQRWARAVTDAIDRGSSLRQAGFERARGYSLAVSGAALLDAYRAASRMDRP